MADLKTLTFSPKIVGTPPFSVEVPDAQAVDGESKPRRHPTARDGLFTTPDPSIKTVWDIVTRAAATFGNAKAVGRRKLIKTHTETKKVKKIINGEEQLIDKKWTYFELSGYTYLSFVEYEASVKSIGSGLRKLGLTKGDKVHLFAQTAQSWITMSHGAVSQSMSIVTAYDTLGEDGLKHSLTETNAKLIYLDPHLLKTLINPLKEAKDIKFAVYSSEAEVSKEDIDKLKAAHPELKVLSFDELLKLGEENPADPVPPGPEDLACIMYTSGSTGPPKGVPLLHKNVVAAVSGANGAVGQYIGPGDVLLAYLPAAHILEFVFENTTMFWGGRLDYGNPRTLSDASVRNCVGDIKESKPTILVGVPAVFETVKKGIISKVNSSGAVTKNLFWGAFNLKSFLNANGIPGSGILDAIVFNKVRENTGGKIRILLSGGGPISKETQHFLSIAICPMVIGYGLTETCAMGTIMDPREWNNSSIGAMTPAVEMKLVDYPDAGYLSSSKPPQGEIWIRGQSVSSGYWKNEKETAEAYAPGGWFKTGDIGEFDDNGHVRIIDRKKNLVKTLNGEYIALEKLESVYRAAPVVANICVYASEDKTKPVAIIVPAEPALKKLAEENGIEGSHLEEFVHNPKILSIVTDQLLKQGKIAGLRGIELIDGVVLTEEEWTPQNNFITSAQKLNRRKILDTYKGDIQKAYEQS